MTAILREIRRLDAARQRGELNDMEYINAKARLLETVEEAQIDASQPIPRPRPKPVKPAASAEPAPAGQPGIWFALLIFVAGAALVTLIATVLLGDLNLALTLTATLSAAVVVAAFTRLED